MTTETLNFPVFHSEQGIESDIVNFSSNVAIGDVTKAKDLELTKVAANGDAGRIYPALS